MKRVKKDLERASGGLKPDGTSRAKKGYWNIWLEEGEQGERGVRCKGILVTLERSFIVHYYTDFSLAWAFLTSGGVFRRIPLLENKDPLRRMTGVLYIIPYLTI